MKFNHFTLTLVLTFFLTACGGGSSSGGDEQSKNLTSCVNQSLSVSSDNISIYNYTNNCTEPVNLSTGYLTASSINTVRLEVNQSHSESTLFALSYIACRPPSIGVDGDATAGLQLECS